ncbi:MAG: hypothetical protein AB1733_12690 [Thermodesulfobacteriota bacterium]
MNFPAVSPRGLLVAVFCVSAAVIGWQLGLMRCLLISKYHHFSFLIISCALLGFGAGGTVLALWKGWFHRSAVGVFRWATPLFGITVAFSFRVGEALPVRVYFPPADAGSTVAWWMLFWLLHCVPFLIAGLLIGLALMIEEKNPQRVYAVNLTGSALGALVTIVLLNFIPANGLVAPLALSVLLPSFLLLPPIGSRTRIPYFIGLILVSLAFCASLLVGVDRLFPLRIDEYKPLAYVRQLVDQGAARSVVSFSGPRGRIDLFSSPHFHTLLSLSPDATPPPMDMLFLDGFGIGSVLSIDDPMKARFLEGTLMSLPYRLIRPETVLILGDAGGLGVWLARLSQARSIVLVQPDRNIIRVLKSHPSRVLEDPRVRVVIMEPRAFLDSTRLSFDLIHCAALEGFAAGSGGIGALRENYLATVEGFAASLRVLTPSGIVSVVRGIQDPPRDNIKIPATWIEALESRGVLDPGSHLLLARDELSMATLVRNAPIGKELVEKFRKICRTMSWDTEWFPGVQPDDTNAIHVLPGPEVSGVSWYHYAMEQLLSDKRAILYRTWLTIVEPAIDDRPFFYDFFKWKAVSKLREAFGPLWPTRSEMGYLLLLAAGAWCVLVGGILLLFPLIFLVRWKEVPSMGTLALTTSYFAALGTAFMLLEMSFIQMFTRFLGDPVLSAALVVGGFLISAGAGSLAAPRITAVLPAGILPVGSAIGLLAVLATLGLPLLFSSTAHFSQVAKIAFGLGIICPLAFLLGIPFPWGIALLHRRAPAVIPLAWAVNGFASVISTCGAVLLSMTVGFTVLSYLAAAVYAGAGFFSLALGHERT